MHTILSLLLLAVLPSLRDRAALQLELIALRHQLLVLERKRTTRCRSSKSRRWRKHWQFSPPPATVCDMQTIVIILVGIVKLAERELADHGVAGEALHAFAGAVITPGIFRAFPCRQIQIRCRIHGDLEFPQFIQEGSAKYQHIEVI